jgi:hypothetical protein
MPSETLLNEAYQRAVERAYTPDKVRQHNDAMTVDHETRMLEKARAALADNETMPSFEADMLVANETGRVETVDMGGTQIQQRIDNASEGPVFSKATLSLVNPPEGGGPTFKVLVCQPAPGGDLAPAFVTEMKRFANSWTAILRASLSREPIH